MNSIYADGLRACATLARAAGYPAAEAAEFEGRARRSFAMLATGGIREFYDPRTAEGRVDRPLEVLVREDLHLGPDPARRREAFAVRTRPGGA